MGIEENQVGKKKGLSKGLIISIVVALLVVGGSVAAYVSVNNPSSLKAKYFQAEKNSIDFIYDTVEKRFESELQWLELTEEKPTESSIELSAEYNDPYGGSDDYDFVNPAEIINGSTLTITTQSDIAKKKLAVELEADVAGFKIDDIHLYLTEEKFMLSLPFLKELLQIKAKDAGKLLHEAMPEYVTEDEEIDFGKIFEQSSGYFSEADMKHFKKEYLEMILTDLPESAFTSSKEKVDINKEAIDAEKISLHLTEEQFKKLLTSILDKLHKDEIVKDLIKDQFSNQMYGLSNAALLVNNEMDELISEFEAGILEAIEELKDFQIPNGFTSTIWVNDKLIVKRDLAIEMGPSKDELVKLAINGTQLLTETSQTFSYEIGYADEYDEGTVSIIGDLSWKGDQIKDSIKLVVEDVEIAYEAEESLKKGVREFDRSIALIDEYNGGKLIWSGESTYEKDNMRSTHDFSLETNDFDQDLFSLHAIINGKQIKDVNIPEDNVKDLGSMTIDEIMTYVEEDAATQFQQWLMNIMMSAGGDFGF